MRIAYREPVSNAVINGGFDDAIQLSANESLVEGNTILDPYEPSLFNGAHRDGIQLIPRRNDGRYNTQYAAANLSDVTIRNNRISSCNKLQCIFSSDGLLSNLTITNNILDTQGQHYITLGGLLSGRIEGNRRADGSLCPIQLEPLRIGGNNQTGNLWVVSFKDGYDYAPVESIVLDASLEHVTDNRRGHGEPRKDGIYLTDFDVDAFYTETAKAQYSPQGLQALALNFGNFVSLA